MAAVTVFSLTWIHYKYHQVAERILPHEKATSAVLIHLNALQGYLGLIRQGDADDRASNQSVRERVKAIRAVNAELSLRQGAPAQSGTLVENFVRSLAVSAPEDVRYLQGIMTATDHIDQALDGYLASQGQAGAVESYEAAKQAVDAAIALAEKHAGHVAGVYAAANDDIYKIIRDSVHAILVVLLVASALLILFVGWIIVAFQQPISAIIQQIESLSTGDIDVAKKVSIRSEDEIGTLSHKFNALVDSVYGMTIYKQVIEEDSSLDDIYRRLGEVFERDLGIAQYTIYEVDPHSREMRIGYPPPVGDAHMHCDADILADCLQCRAIKTGHKVSSFDFAGVCRRYIPEEGVGHVCIPMMAGGNTSGVVQMRFEMNETGRMRDPVAQQKLFNAATYINQSLSVIEAKRLMQTLRDSAMIDPLTGLYNRRFLQEHTKQLISGVLRRKKQIGLLICDLDYFKKVNDTHGHDAGDLILKETAQVLKSMVRDTDVVIRFGGEEFLVLLLDVELGDAMLIAEKIRAAIEAMKVNIGERTLQKTISIGVAEFPEDSDGFWQAIKYADVAMYQAKEQGRNRAVHFTPEMWQHGGDF